MYVCRSSLTAARLKGFVPMYVFFNHTDYAAESLVALISTVVFLARF